MKDNSGKIILALLAGASAGVVAGILMAPETGEVSRGNLKKSASKLGQDLESKLQASMEQLQALSTSAGALLSKLPVGGNAGGSADVVQTGSNTTPTSHLDGIPNGGNDGSADGNTKGGTTGRGKGKKAASSGSGDSTGSGGGSNASA
ncbi:YtxH domain-containing protein [Rufibacter roseus]|uniref:YtxH domain-containing protein n=1 Tax=Rufibacter roseus TaxID=1567108 RepID=A0ABW2DM51_9BACT|nr:YtxH domain-containing protein [Rufibacter roseus]